MQWQTISIIPPDLAKMRVYMGIPVPQPSIEHTLTQCVRCGGDGWIGPAQRLHYIFNGGEVVCYRCLFEKADAVGALPEMIGLDATADEKPRRT